MTTHCQIQQDHSRAHTASCRPISPVPSLAQLCIVLAPRLLLSIRRLLNQRDWCRHHVLACGSNDLTSICLQMLVGNSASHSGHNRAWPQPPAPCSSHLELHAISLPLLRLLMHMLVRFRTVLRHSSSHANTTFFFCLFDFFANSAEHTQHTAVDCLQAHGSARHTAANTRQGRTVGRPRDAKTVPTWAGATRPHHWMPLCL
jgi:hypothetical protein